MPITQRGGLISAADGASADNFGAAVSIVDNGTLMVIGAPQWEGGLTNQGGVYVYDWDGAAWVQRDGVLVATDAAISDGFGTSTAIAAGGGVMAVGAPQWEGSLSDQGGVYILDWDGVNWIRRGNVLVAGDASSSAEYGASVALNADTAEILAVGAPNRTGTVLGQGGVYIYDWNVTSWVQRGSVLVAADATTGNAPFGTGVALSGAGTVLAVGARLHNASGTQSGGVYVYDWNGTSWVQRGSVLVATDAAVNDNFGYSVALSVDGAVLAVGAPQWEGSLSNQGGVYLYDWNGTSWVQRDSALVAGNAASGDYFGHGVGLSFTADVLVVGAPNAAAGLGGVYVYDVLPGDLGLAAAPTQLTINDANAGIPTAPTSLTINQATYAPAAPTQLTIYAIGTPVAPTALAVIDIGLAVQWTAICLVSGVDVSGRLTGMQTVEAEEGAARIASVQLLPTSGPLLVLDYVGRTITLDFVRIVAGASVPFRIFTGRIDTPVYDLSTGIIALSCTDDLQNRIAAESRDTLDMIIGGRYTVAVQGEILDNWDYSQSRMTTVAASLDADAMGGLRVTQWEGLPLFSTFGNGDLIYESSSVSFPQRTDIINRVTIDYEYRYPRLRQRFTTVGFSATRAEMNQQGYLYPTQQEIASAVGGSGWVQTLGVYYPAPVTIPHSTGGNVRTRAGAIDMAIIYLTQRHGQQVTEGYSIVVEAPESITQNGVLPHALRGALSSEFDYQVWENDLSLPPLMPTGGEQDYAPDASRIDSDYALQTLLDQARVKILSSHRGAEVSNATTCNPQIDLNKRIRILTGTLDADGKVRRVSHALDLSSGSATTEFSIALFGAGGAGIITPDVLTPPAPPAPRNETQDWGSAVPSLWVNIYGVTPYSPNLMGLLLNPEPSYTVEDVPDGLGGFADQSYTNPFYVAGSYPETGFRIAMPGVDEADRNPVEVLTPKTYSVVLPANTLTITVP